LFGFASNCIDVVSAASFCGFLRTPRISRIDTARSPTARRPPGGPPLRSSASDGTATYLRGVYLSVTLSLDRGTDLEVAKADREMGKLPTMLCTAFCILVAAAPAARAARVPTLDIAPTCRGIARHARGPGERGGPDLSYRSCIRSELQIRRRLAKRWLLYTAAEKADCVGETTASGIPSYTDLATCLEMERAARQSGFSAPPDIER
jgi:hypothetical protein